MPITNLHAIMSRVFRGVRDIDVYIPQYPEAFRTSGGCTTIKLFSVYVNGKVQFRNVSRDICIDWARRTWGNRSRIRA